MKGRKLLRKAVPLLLFACLVVLYVEFRTNGFNDEKKAIRTHLDKQTNLIGAKADSILGDFETASVKELKKQSNHALKDHIVELKRIEKEIAVSKSKLEQAKLEQERKTKNLPSYVDLETLNQYYVDKFKNGIGSEVFETSKGTIKFYNTHFIFKYAHNPYGLAFMRIGKINESNDDVDLIKAWLDESALFKVLQGYRLVSNKTEKIDYGEYTEEYYNKGDMYFKTFYKYERVQGTYNSTSFQYTFYIEVGSIRRKTTLQIDEYNHKLGS